MKSSEINFQSRNPNADLVRVLAMFMVVILHVARMSGFLSLSYEYDAVGKWISNCWEAPTIIAVNLFALLTGFLCVNKKWRISRYLALWMQVSFYVLLIEIAKWIYVGEPSSMLYVLTRLFPLTSPYWYFIAYSALFVFMPFLNRGIRNMNKNDCFLLCLASVVVLSFLGFASTDALAARGHCVLWLGVMYICGAYMKLHLHLIPSQESARIQKRRKMAAFFIFALCCGLGCLVLKRGGNVENLLFRHYQSPIVCMEALSFFFLLMACPIRSIWSARLLKLLSPAAFGVYLFHCGIWGYLTILLKDWAIATKYPWWYIPVLSLAVYTAGTMLEYIRIKLFIILHISDICQFLASKTPRCIRQMENW